MCRNLFEPDGFLSFTWVQSHGKASVLSLDFDSQSSVATFLSGSNLYILAPAELFCVRPGESGKQTMDLAATPGGLLSGSVQSSKQFLETAYLHLFCFYEACLSLLSSAASC